ncbi:MAG: hypothetical protein GH143_03885 [Calditrichaeota bacterium]|nr:hypothetical protein [Calditrichota bacterium]
MYIKYPASSAASDVILNHSADTKGMLAVWVANPLKGFAHALAYKQFQPIPVKFGGCTPQSAIIEGHTNISSLMKTRGKTMKRSMILILLTTLALGLVVRAGPKTLSTTEAINGVGQIKIGYIDSNRIMQEYEEVRDAQAKLEKETRRLQVEYNTYVERLDSLNREFERLRSKLSNEKIREKEQELQSLYQTTQAFQQAKFGPEGELYRYQAQLMAPVLDKVDAAVKRIGAAI